MGGGAGVPLQKLLYIKEDLHDTNNADVDPFCHARLVHDKLVLFWARKATIFAHVEKSLTLQSQDIWRNCDSSLCRYYDKFIARCILHAQQQNRERPLLGKSLPVSSDFSSAFPFETASIICLWILALLVIGTFSLCQRALKLTRCMVWVESNTFR